MTTHNSAVASLRSMASGATNVPGARYIDNRPAHNIVSAAGVAAGIDIAFHLVERLVPTSTAQRAVKIMEYNRTRNFTE